MSLSEQREVLQIAELYREELIQQWEQFLSGQKVEIIKINCFSFDDEVIHIEQILGNFNLYGHEA